MRGVDASGLRRPQSVLKFEQTFTSLFGHLTLDDVLAARNSDAFRDGWIGLHFAQATSADQIWLTPRGAHNDFVVTRGEVGPIEFQATESLATGRRRGDERRKHRDQIREISQEEMEAEESAAGATLLSSCERKLRAGNTRLVIYWNFAIFRQHGFDDEIAAGLRSLIGDCFEELWLIRDAQLILIKSNEWAGY